MTKYRKVLLIIYVKTKKKKCQHGCQAHRPPRGERNDGGLGQAHRSPRGERNDGGLGLTTPDISLTISFPRQTNPLLFASQVRQPVAAGRRWGSRAWLLGQWGRRRVRQEVGLRGRRVRGRAEATGSGGGGLGMPLLQGQRQLHHRVHQQARGGLPA